MHCSASPAILDLVPFALLGEFILLKTSDFSVNWYVPVSPIFVSGIAETALQAYVTESATLLLKMFPSVKSQCGSLGRGTQECMANVFQQDHPH